MLKQHLNFLSVRGGKCGNNKYNSNEKNRKKQTVTKLLVLVSLLVVALISTIFLTCCGTPHDPSEGRPKTGSQETTSSETNDRHEGDPSTVQRQPIDFSVASLNAHLLWDTKCDSQRCDGSWERQYTQGELDSHVQRLKSDILKLDADVILLQEVETEQSLFALRDALEAYPHAAIAESGGYASIDTAVLSKYPFDAIHTYDITRSSVSARLMIEAQLTVEGRKVAVFGVHFQAKRSNHPGHADNLRRTQADNAQKHIAQFAQQNSDYALILGGDFNDTPESAPINTIKNNNFEVVSGEPGQWWTYDYRGDRQVIDYLFYYKNGKVEPDGKLFVHHDTRGSDHSAIRAKFKLH